MTAPLDLAPMDDNNRRLLGNVHPEHWQNPHPAPMYNLVVIGAGSAGLVSAAGAAGLGAKVALIEERFLGGDCLNFGCVPSKALIRSARVAAAVDEAGDHGVTASASRVDFPAVMERLRRRRAKISKHDSAQRFRELGVDVFLGSARFSGRDSVEVEGHTLRFKRAIIASGSRPKIPDIEGLAEAGYLTNETVFSLTSRPEHLVVIGGGPIGCELAQAFRRLGSRVTLIQRGRQLLKREDSDAVEVITCRFQREGIEILFEAQVRQVVADGDTKRIVVDSPEQVHEIKADRILVAAGRSVDVSALGLEAAQIAYSAEGITVDDTLRTSNSRVYAAGDVCLRHKFTHTADASARIVLQNALFPGFKKKLSALTVPWCTYTDPEVARVGLNERQAAENGIHIDTYRRELSEVDRAVLDGQTEGFVKVHTAEGTDRIVGATIVAAHAGEMISEITTAMVGKVGLKALGSVIHPYPTQTEAIKHTADTYNRTRLTARTRHLFEHWFSWLRR